MNTTTPFSVPTTAQVAATLERGARTAAPMICWAVAAVMTAAQIAYQLGHGLGSAVHARNDQLAALARQLATAQPQAPRPTHVMPVVRPTDTLQPACEPQEQPQTPCRVVTTPAPLPHPLAALRDELASLTVAELRSITGTRRKMPKAQLVTLALAMA